MQQIILSGVELGEFKTFITECFKSEFAKLAISEKEPSTEFITAYQAAKLLGISLPTLRVWTRKELIPVYRISSRVRYQKNEVLNSLKKVKK